MLAKLAIKRLFWLSLIPKSSKLDKVKDLTECLLSVGQQLEAIMTSVNSL